VTRVLGRPTRPTRLTRLTASAGSLALAALLVACGGSSTVPAGSGAAKPTGDWFTDGAQAAGIDFVHFNGMSGERYYPEIMAPGVALFDYDNDGDLDAYLVQSQILGKGKTLKDAIFPPTGPLKDRLYRNDLKVAADGSRTLRFTDVTDASGIAVESYGMGVAAGDYDNDGFVDLYRTGLKGAVLLHNNGNGTFSDVTAKAGAGNPDGWGVSSSFVDYDRDGFLDLFVGNYLLYTTEGDIDCLAVTGQHDYCPPNSYRAQPSRLYRNRGNGTFDDVTRKALLGGAYGPALGVSTADFDGDGWLDIYVGNDGVANQLWINQKNGTFKDTAFLSGAAVNGAGNAEASMGIDAGDYDNDGDQDLFITNWLAQMNILYVNDGKGAFEDAKAASGLGPPSLAKTGFGTAWFDYDNDSWLDLLTLNGSVSIIEAQARANDPFPLKMKNQLYRNLANGRFEDVSGRAGAVFQREEVSRGGAFGDVDNDGDPDVLVGVAAGPTRLLINNVGSASSWIGVRLVGAGGKRDALGARAEIRRPNAPPLVRRARSDGSYASANDPRVLAGLGPSAPATVAVRVSWPDGKTEDWTAVPTGRYTTLVQGQAK
jgi:enediyne biosynthesis protein E4